jgi:putative peptidoglycan lipid II flippase
MGTSLYKKVGLATLIMTASVFVSRVIGLVREMVIADVAGMTGAVDAYQVSFVLPEILNHVVASGFLSITFIPIFSRYLAENNESEGWRVFHIVLTGLGSLLLVLIAVSVYLAPTLVDIFAPGIDPILKVEAVKMTRIILPAQFFFFTGGLFMAVQFARERFFLPALAPLIYNLGIIFGGIIFSSRLGMQGFSWGVLVGAFVGNFLLQYLGARRVGMRLALNWKLGHPDFRAYIYLTFPLMVGLTMTFSTEIFLKLFGSFLPQGNIAGLNYALRIMMILVGFFGQAVGVASFPFMARLAAEKKIDEMNRLLNNTMRYLALVVPFAVLIMVLRHEVVFLLYQRGKFDAAATDLTAGILVFMMVGAFAFAAQTVVVRGFYALRNTLFPAVFGTIAVVISIPFYMIGMRTMGANGIALAISISVTLQVMLLFAIWNRQNHNKGSGSVYAFLFKTVLFSTLMGLGMAWVRHYLVMGIDTATFLGCLLVVTAVGGLFLVILVIGAFVLRIEEVAKLLTRIKEKIQKPAR